MHQAHKINQFLWKNFTSSYVVRFPLSILSHNCYLCSSRLPKFYSTESISYKKNVDDESFGALAKKHGLKIFDYHSQYEGIDELEDSPHVPFREKKSAFGFQYECKKLAKQGRLEECIKLFEHTMLKEQKVKPQERNFAVVIGSVAIIGDVDKALSLFYKLKEYGISPSAASYTALFHAFANSPEKRLDDLRRISADIEEKKVVLNRKAYNVLLKVHAKHSSLEQSMAIFRNSIVAGFEPDVVTFTYLMLCCQKDEKNGFRYALQLWRQMVNLDIKPDGILLIHFLLVTLHCGIGDISVANQVLLKQQPHKIEGFLKRYVRNFRWLKGQESLPDPVKYDEIPETIEPMTLLETTVHDAIESKFTPPCDSLSSRNIDAKESSSKNMLELQKDQCFANLIVSDSSVSQQVVSIQKCIKPSERFQLIGGVENVFRIIKHYNIIPTVMLVTVIGKLIDESCSAEDEFMLFAERLKIKLDVDFYNTIMHRRAKRGKFREVQEIFDKLKTKKIEPNYRTWCIYAMTCQYYSNGRKLIENIQDANVKTDVVFYTTLLAATMRNPKNTLIDGYTDVRYPNYRYLSYILQQMKQENITANEKLITLLEKTVVYPEGYNRWKCFDPVFEKKISQFRKLYKEWLAITKVEM